MLLYSESHSGALGSTVWGVARWGWALLAETYLLQVTHVWPWPWEIFPAAFWRVSNTQGAQ